MSDLHETIAGQVAHMKPDHLVPGVDVGMVVIDEDTLAVIVGDERTDIRYDHGPDTYTVTRSTKIGRYWIAKGEPVSDVYCDQLGEMVFGDEAKPWTMPFGGIVWVNPETGETEERTF